VSHELPGADEIAALVIDCVRGVLGRTGSPLPARLDRCTALVGHGAVLDSIGLVMLVVEVEQRLEEEHGLSLVLASDKALSQTRSPFRDVGSLIDYAGALIAAGRQDG
jgi:acyl carrier protein